MNYGIVKPVLAAFFISVALSPLMIRYLHKLKFGQFIRGEGPESHLKKSGTPTMGGLIILLGIVIASLFYVKDYPAVIPILFVTLGFGFIGFIDDYIKVVMKRNLGLKAWQKMLGQICVTGIFAYYLINYTDTGTLMLIPFTHGKYLDLGIFFVPGIFLILLGTVNGANFTDGLDGLASGIVAIGGIAFAIYSYIIARSSPSYASMATLIDVAMVGICVGFILHNWHPAKLFMGDSGSMLLGYLITCASIIMTGRLDPASIHTSIYLPVFMPILLPVLVLFLPVLDMCMAIVRRVRKGQSPMHPDRMHLHHRMLKIGHSVQGAVLILWGWAALISFGSIMILFFPARFVAIGFAMAVVLLTVATMYPYLKHRIPELRAENARLEAARRAAAAGGPKASDGDGDGASAGVGTGDKAGVSD